MKHLALMCFAAGGVAIAAPAAATTFNKDVLPILQKNCQSCHRPGQIAPMSFLSYQDVRPWAKAIKLAVISRKMPPWMADPVVAAAHPLANDRTLTQRDIDTLSGWADNNAVEGDAKDKPAPIELADGGWLMGKPDVVFKLRAMTLPPVKRAANGYTEDRVPFVNFVLPTGFTEDMWVAALQIKPGNRAVVHHAGVDAAPPGSAWYAPKGLQPGQGYYEVERATNLLPPEAPIFKLSPSQGMLNAAAGNHVEVVGLGGYSPGHELVRYNSARPDAGRLLPANSWLRVQIHYTATEKPETDATEIGFYFLKQPAKYRYAQTTISSAAPTPDGIPWGSTLDVTRTAMVQAPIEIGLFMPHMHRRGQTMTYRAIYPTGESEDLMKVVNFSWDWQLPYELAKPISLPKGTKIEVTAHYDNTANNKANPYVGEKAEWGDQTWNEMFIGFMGMLVPADTNPAGLLKVDRAAR